MRLVDKRAKVSRRGFIGGAGATTVGLFALTVGAGTIASPSGGWAMSVKNLTPETMRTLVQLARDIYPHDHLADTHYAAAVAGYDDMAGEDEAAKAMIEGGVAMLDRLAAAAHAKRYVAVGWEIDRVALLRRIENDVFFQTIRGGLVTGLYNNKDVWARFGYEGSSWEQGGYLDRGFDDIDWV